MPFVSMGLICRARSGQRDAPVVIALASNERYFPGLYCAVASSLAYMAADRAVDLRILDGGISETSRDILSRLAKRFGKSVRLEFVSVDQSIFCDATLGPGRSHVAYCRILLPRLEVSRLIYLDCDVLVFRDLSTLFDVELPRGKVLAAVPDSETLTLGDDSQVVAAALGASPGERYFNSGVLLMDLDKLRTENFTHKAFEFLRIWKGKHRFHDQSVINFLLQGRIETLPECWNRAAWRFDEQLDNNLSCVLHYTSSAPWLRETPGPAQVLFERFAVDVGLPVNRQSFAFRKSARRRSWQNGLVPLRALAFPLASLLYRIAGKEEKSAAYQKVARYWFNYVRNAPTRRRLHRQRSREISEMKFNLHTLRLVS
jgi:lipopolysaccharide biosynthesis glycosyltransferase